MTLIDKRAWAGRVRDQMKASEVRGRSVLVLAGMNYREWLYSYLIKHFHHMDIPMAGLTMGQQLSWLSKNLSDGVAYADRRHRYEHIGVCRLWPFATVSVVK